jgi:hypothetical protein
MKITYEQAKAAIERAYKAGDLTAQEREEKLQLAEKLKEKQVIPKAQPIKIKPKPRTQGEPNTGVEKCKETLAQYQAKKKAEKVEQAKKELLAKAETPEKKEEIQNLSDSEILAKANPKPRIDVLSREELRKLAEKNIKTRLANLPQKEKKEIPEDKIKEIANTLYQELDKLIDKLLR